MILLKSLQGLLCRSSYDVTVSPLDWCAPITQLVPILVEWSAMGTVRSKSWPHSLAPPT